MTEAPAKDRRILPTTLLVMWFAVGLIFVWSAIHPHDYFTWILEVFPAIIGGVILAATYRRFRLTPLVYILIAIHMVILMIGGRYTYAEVPFGNWIRDLFALSRNHYDRLGHFAQGFVPAMIAREVLLRLNVLKRGRWLSVLVVSVCLAFSALYELLEWIVSALTGSAGDAFWERRATSLILKRTWRWHWSEQ